MHPRFDTSPAVLSRRRVAVGIVAALGGVAAGSVSSYAKASQEGSTQPKELGPCIAPNQARTSIHYDLNFKASPERFYDTILDQAKFAAFSRAPAAIDPTVGGAFFLFGKLIVGRNVELLPNVRIVQAWRPASWDPGVYSSVHFELKANGEGTDLAFDHTGFPSGLYDHLDWGWKNHYWEGLRKYFG
jgi:activator of HSP90 ATPase